MNILIIPWENEGFYLKLTSDLDDKFYKRLAFRNLERTCQWIRRNLKTYTRSECAYKNELNRDGNTKEAS